MMSRIFDRLGYNFQPKGNDVINFSEDAKSTLNAVPKLLDQWQYDAVATGDTEGYLKNPTKNTTVQIVSTVGQILSTSSGVDNLGGIVSRCLNIVDHFVQGPTESSPPVLVLGSSTKYIDHCDRLSGVVEPNEETAQLPHYDTALAVGKSVTYIVNQADGIEDNSPVMGNFTSILVDNDLVILYSDILPYPNLIAASITCTTSDDGTGNTITVCTSNLSSQQITQIQNKLNDIDNIFDGRRIHDENFFNNSRAVLDDFQKLRRFKDMGQSEKNLVQNYIGTEKLLIKIDN
jgi:hypothetical protein